MRRNRPPDEDPPPPSLAGNALRIFAAYQPGTSQRYQAETERLAQAWDALSLLLSVPSTKLSS